MNCAELAEEYREIRDLIAPEASFEDNAEGSRLADELNQRVDELGGCSGEPSLQ